MIIKKGIFIVQAVALMALLPGCLAGEAEESAEAEEIESVDSVEQAAYTEHAIVTCASATMYGNSAPANPIRTLYYGDKVGIRIDGGTASWAVILDYGPDDWGFLLRSCMTRCYGANNPIAGCF